MMTEETTTKHDKLVKSDQLSIDLCTKGLVDKIKSPVQGIDVGSKCTNSYPVNTGP